jgi:hypothetical protein
MFKSVTRFFDVLEDKVRIRISRYPIFFALVGGVAIVEFWRGVWQLTDYLFLNYLNLPIEGFWSNIISIVIGTFLLLVTGLYVSLFISDSVIISGIKKDRKEFEKVKTKMEEEEKNLALGVKEIKEIKKEEDKVDVLNSKIDLLMNEVTTLKNELAKK